MGRLINVDSEEMDHEGTAKPLVTTSKFRVVSAWPCEI
jgi:hypothetical protein